jgi:ribosomal protein L1
MVRGVTLPHGTGKDVKVLALVTRQRRLGDYVGLDTYN